MELAEQGRLPNRIDSASDLSVAVVQELTDAGYLKAIDASSFSGPACLEPKIALPGREYLDGLRKEREKRDVEAKNGQERAQASAEGMSDLRDAWLEIEGEYGVSKRSFGKRVNFVKDKFKRQVIYRDIEQAFTLARHGFSKPAVVLAGGVIEELLRLYLEHKSVAQRGNSLDSYIKACRANALLKAAVNQLADVVRQFRNIVHLKMESSAKHTISKATAKAAVSSIFTIANDFRP